MISKEIAHLERLAGILEQISADRIPGDLIPGVKKGLEVIKSLSHKQPSVIVFDTQGILNLNGVSEWAITELKELPESSGYTILPPHQLWVFACSIIQAHSLLAQNTLLYLRAWGQAGRIVIRGAGDPLQKAKAESALSKAAGLVKIDFTNGKKNLQEILPAGIELSECLELAAPKAFKTILYQIAKDIRILKDEVERLEDQAHTYNKFMIGGIARLWSEFPDNFAQRFRTEIRYLRDMKPDFDWLSAIGAIEECVSRQETGKEKTHETGNDETDKIAGAATDNAHSETSADANGKKDGEEPKADTEATKQAHRKINEAVQEQCKRAILNHLDQAFERRFGLSDHVQYARRLHPDTGGKSRIAEVYSCVGLKDRPLPNPGSPPDWPLTDEKINSIVDDIIAGLPLPYQLLQYLTVITMRIRRAGKFVLPVANYALLNKWAGTVYEGVVDTCSLTLEKYHHNELSKWSDGYLESLKKAAGQCREAISSLERVGQILDEVLILQVTG